jgi:hypothetical protein
MDRSEVGLRRAERRCPKAIVDCRSLNDNPRNSIDRVFFEGVAKTGGLMGVSALDAVMTWKRKDAPRAETGRANVARPLPRRFHVRHIAAR